MSSMVIRAATGMGVSSLSGREGRSESSKTLSALFSEAQCNASYYHGRLDKGWNVNPSMRYTPDEFRAAGWLGQIAQSGSGWVRD
jgi:hypothetical protein